MINTLPISIGQAFLHASVFVGGGQYAAIL